LVPPEVVKYFAESLGKRGGQLQSQWTAEYSEYRSKFPAEAKQLDDLLARRLPEDWDADLKHFPADEKGLATRASSGKALNMLAPRFPWLIGGSADLAPSTLTLLDGENDFSSDCYSGRNLRFGIREHAMASILSGISLSGLRPFGATFFVFTDYLRPAMRLSSLMHQPVLYVLTHDSIGVGEDGPTHQPIEHLAACRAIPGLYVFRPGDANEVLESYRTIMQIPNHPSALILSRQNVPTIDREKFAPASGVSKGAYILIDSQGQPDCILIGTGSELILCIQAAEKLREFGIAARVVSMPCQELFDQQPADYRSTVLPESCTVRVACEAGVRQGWDRYIGNNGYFVGMNSFGASAPGSALYKHFKITADQIVSFARVGISGSDE
jgi:transketolase